MRHKFLAVLAVLAILLTSERLCFAQQNAANISQTKQVKSTKPEKFKKQVEKIRIGGKITVIRLDKRDFYGSVSSLAADGFQIVEVDLKQTIDFKYTEIEKIKTGDGGKSMITGKRSNHKNGWLFGVAIFGTLFVILGVALSKDR